MKDSDMPMPPPNPTGQVGPSPTENSIPPGSTAAVDDFPPGQTGEEVDAGIANAGGVDAPNTDGSTRT